MLQSRGLGGPKDEGSAVTLSRRAAEQDAALSEYDQTMIATGSYDQTVRLWELPGGMINSIGLPNKGLHGYLEHDLPQLARLPVPLITNVMGSTEAEVARLVEAVDARAEVAAIELNVSCPNVRTGLDIGADPGSKSVYARTKAAGEKAVFEAVKDALEKAGLKAEVAEVTMRAANTVALFAEDAQRMQKLLDVIEDLDDVQDVFHNAELAE